MINNQLFDGLLIFVQVVRQGSFSAAADRLGFSNAHVSKEVSRLEDRLGTRLLNRTTRSLSLTPDGQSYFERCVDIVEQAEAAFNLMTQQDERPRGRLKVSCPIGIGRSFIQPVLAEYLRRFPGVSLEWDLSDTRTDLVAEGVDLAIRAAPSLDESSLICRKIYSCPSYVVVAPSFIEKFGRPNHPRELKHFNCICYSNLAHPNHWRFDVESDHPFTVEVKDHILCNNGDLEIEMTKAGAGICYLPAFYMLNELETGELEVLFPEHKMAEINVYAIYPSRKHLSPKVRVLIDMLTEAF